jgi:hypothetical protein
MHFVDRKSLKNFENRKMLNMEFQGRTKIKNPPGKPGGFFIEKELKQAYCTTIFFVTELLSAVTL